MTIVVTVKINEGIVLAADSATTFMNQTGHVVKIYNSANKLFNLVKGLPIGSLTFGSGSIGNSSIATLTKDLRRRLAGKDPKHIDWMLDPERYTMEEVARKVKKFFYDEKFQLAYQDEPPDNFLAGYKICGYSAGADQPELWDVPIRPECPEPVLLRGEAGPAACGPNWDGEYEAMNRLLLGVGCRFAESLITRGIDPEVAEQIQLQTIADLRIPVDLPAMPIQDAIELARFMVETTIRFVRFNLRSETVGGPIEIAVITKHEGFRWVQRKLFFESGLNPPLG
jgi:hypothetical protein